MPVEKVSLSLEADVVAEARAESGGNLSAYVNEAVAARLRNRELRRVLDEFKHEFPPIDPDEEGRIQREFDEGLARIEAANQALEETLIRGTDALSEHPLVGEALIALGPLGLPIGYVELSDQSVTVEAAFAELEAHLARSVPNGWRVQFVIVGRDPKGHAALPSVTP